MKKTTKLLTLALVLVLALGLAGCGAKTSYTVSEEAYDIAPMEAPASAESFMDAGFANTASGSTLYSENGDRSAFAEPADMSEKIIYSASARLETTEFDTALEKIQALVKELGGFMESTSISGNNYSSIARGSTGGRSASYTIRVPSDKFALLTGSLSDIGNVPYCNTYMQNVTMEYYDVQSRLEAYKTQETRLLEMLAVAESVEDMLAIQQQLTDVQYEIDSLSGRLRYYDHQVAYSTVSLDVTEVREYTPEPTITLTYWQRMTRGFAESLKNVGEFFQDLFLWFVTSLPSTKCSTAKQLFAPRQKPIASVSAKAVAITRCLFVSASIARSLSRSSAARSKRSSPAACSIWLLSSTVSSLLFPSSISAACIIRLR